MSFWIYSDRGSTGVTKTEAVCGVVDEPPRDV